MSSLCLLIRVSGCICILMLLSHLLVCRHNDGTNTKAVKKTKKAKTKSKTSNKLSKTRLKSYGL